MKNILAENLLRFGAKNLSEADIKKLHETNPVAAAAGTEANPNKLAGAKVTAKAPTKTLQTSWKTEYEKTASWIANIKMDPATKKWNLVDFRFTPDGTPAVETLELYNNNIMRGYVKEKTENGEMGYTGPGMSPLASLNNLLSQVAKQTGVQYGIHVDLKNTLSALPNRYYSKKTSKVNLPTGTEALKPGVLFGVQSLINPDTNQVVNRLFYIGDTSYGVYLEPNNTLSKVSIANLAKKLKSQPNYVRDGIPQNLDGVDFLKSDISKLPLADVL